MSLKPIVDWVAVKTVEIAIASEEIKKHPNAGSPEMLSEMNGKLDILIELANLCMVLDKQTPKD